MGLKDFWRFRFQGVARWGLIVAWMLVFGEVRAQWLSQSFTLKPGWNAIFTHVDASHLSLDSLVPDANGPVAEIWLWKPSFSTAQFIESPYADPAANYQWGVWTSARGDTDTLTTFVGNSAYLVNNRSSSDFVWVVKGAPVPPKYQWTTTGLNFIGFPTPAAAPPNFAAFLSPEPGLDLAKTLQNAARVYRYPGGSLGASNPSEVVSFTASTTPVRRGEAFWVRGSTNFYNYYYGPVEVALQNPAGIHYGDTIGTYSLRLKNLTSNSRTVALNLLPSETPPAGERTIAAVPPLLLRGELSSTSLTYDYTVLDGQTFTLAPAGQPGSELQVVLGLNRSALTAAVGSLYAGILRVTDTAGLQQTDVPVSATVASVSGLWVGQASINQVGQYLKAYPKVDVSQSNQAEEINAAAAQANLPPQGAEMPGAEWVPREANATRAYSAVASSLDGRTVVAAVNGGPLYLSQDYGTTWSSREANRAWSDLASSADGTVIAATVFNGAIYVSSNSGNTFAATGSGSQGWVGVACSADGKRMAAVAQNGSLYTSANGGGSWEIRSGAGVRNWSGVAMSADGSRLVAGVNPGQLFTSADGGGTWRASAPSAAWTAVASSSDGNRLAAVADNGQIYISTDAGDNWSARSVAARWISVASSTDGLRLSATVKNGQIYTSEDAGMTWAAREQARNWDNIVSTGDATRLVGVVNGGAIYTLNRTFASYVVDQTTGLVQDQNGLYLSSGVNTNMARVASVFPLRLILHNRSEDAANQVSLLQRVYVGVGNNSSNTVVATRESLLNPAQISSARRLTATHLPFALENAPWTASGVFNPGSVVIFTIGENYKDHASNPFLHTFHPSHDNLDANFQAVLPRGVESYDIVRTIRLTFSSSGTDFNSLTASAQGRGGTYEETMTIGAQGGASRDFRLSGSFNLQLISPVSVLSQ